MPTKNEEFREFTTNALWKLAIKSETAADLSEEERADTVKKLHEIIHVLENNPKQLLSCIVMYGMNVEDGLSSQRVVIASRASLAAHYIELEEQGKEAVLSCASAVMGIFAESLVKSDNGS